MGTSSGSPVPLFKIRQAEHGRIKDLKELVARIDGMPQCLNGQLVDMGDGVRGLVMGFNPRDVIVLVMGDESRLRLGKPVTGISEPFRIPVGPNFLGRMVTALGEPCDGMGPVAAAAHWPVLHDAPPITAREPVRDLLPTGTKVIDMTVPLAKGQRLLIAGDRMTGKTALALDAILNQRGRECVCIFCAIGKSRTAIQKAVATLQESGALEHTAVLVAADSAPAVEQHLLPFAAATLGEWFAAQGRDVLVVFDDLTKHAWAYRQLALLMDRAPGREAYPGDMFYVQTQLMERAGRFTAEHGGGSLTFLGIVETQQGDLTGLIPSNLSAMCDGQICMSSTRFSEGARPAVDVLQSLSIVGRRVQPPVLRELSANLRAVLTHYQAVSRLGALQVGAAAAADRATRAGATVLALLQQPEGRPVSLAEDVLLLYGWRTRDLAGRSPEAVRAFCAGILMHAQRRDAGLVRALETVRELDPDMIARLDHVMDGYFHKAA